MKACCSTAAGADAARPPLKHTHTGHTQRDTQKQGQNTNKPKRGENHRARKAGKENNRKETPNPPDSPTRTEAPERGAGGREEGGAGLTTS